MKAARAVSVFEQLYVLEQVGLFGGRCEAYVEGVVGEVSVKDGVIYTDDPTKAMIGCEAALALTADHLRDNGHPVILTPLSKVNV
jgi:hypothetical protein